MAVSVLRRQCSDCSVAREGRVSFSAAVLDEMLAGEEACRFDRTGGICRAGREGGEGDASSAEEGGGEGNAVGKKGLDDKLTMDIDNDLESEQRQLRSGLCEACDQENDGSSRNAGADFAFGLSWEERRDKCLAIADGMRDECGRGADAGVK